MNEIERKFLETKLLNIEARISGVEIELISHLEQEPSSSYQWIEARLRALEHNIPLLLKRIEALEEKQLLEKYNAPR